MSTTYQRRRRPKSEQEIVDEKSRLARLEKGLKKWEKTLRTLESSLKLRLAKELKDIEDLKADKTALASEKSVAQAEYDEVADSLKKTKELIKSLERDRHIVSQELDEKTEFLKQVNSDSNLLKKEQKDTIHRLADSDKTLRENRVELKEAIERVKTLREEAYNLKNICNDSESEIRALKRNISRLTQEGAFLTKQVADRQTDSDKLRDKLKSDENRLKELNLKIEEKRRVLVLHGDL